MSTWPASTSAAAGIELVIATDVDNPLLGLRGATNVYGPQKGVAETASSMSTRSCERLADAHRSRGSPTPRGRVRPAGSASAPAGSAASRVGGVDVVADAVGLADLRRAADLVVTGEGAFDFQSRSGKVPYGVARMAGEAIRPCIALAGQVLVGSREMRALGVESAYAMVDLVGEEAAFAEPAHQPGRAGRAGGPHLVTLSAALTGPRRRPSAPVPRCVTDPAARCDTMEYAGRRGELSPGRGGITARPHTDSDLRGASRR